MDLSILESVGGVRTLVVAGGLLVGLVGLKRLLSRPQASAHHVTTRCPTCGWQGRVSRYKPTCPKCARSLGG